MTCRITGLMKPSGISEKGQDQFSNYFLHALQLFYTCNTRTSARTAVTTTSSSGLRGEACNGGKITLYGKIRGGGRNSEQGITAGQYGTCKSLFHKD